MPNAVSPLPWAARDITRFHRLPGDGVEIGRFHGNHGKMNNTISRHRLLFLITGMILLLIPHRAGAAGMDIAMTTWFCQWQPSWSTEKSGYRVKPALFFGPGLSFRLPGKVTVSSGFLYARLKATAVQKDTSSQWSLSNDQRVIKRYDSDTTISYSFNKIFKLYAGFKYTQYRYDNTNTQMLYLLLSLFSGTLEKYRFDNYAPALGFGFTIHVIENFFLLINTSLLYEYSSIIRRAYRFASGVLPIFLSYPQEHWSLHKIGANAHLSFVYFIKAINTNISIGFRYQFFKIVKSGSQYADYSEYYDHFYGLTASVIYRIDFGKKKEPEKNEEL